MLSFQMAKNCSFIHSFSRLLALIGDSGKKAYNIKLLYCGIEGLFFVFVFFYPVLFLGHHHEDSWYSWDTSNYNCDVRSGRLLRK